MAQRPLKMRMCLQAELTLPVSCFWTVQPQHLHAVLYVPRNPYSTPLLAKVSAKDVVADAKATSKKDPCRVLKAVSQIRPADADTPLYKILWENGLTLGVNIRFTQISNFKDYPYIKPREILELLCEKGWFSKVAGLPPEGIQEGLALFWQWFEKLHPKHQIFQQNLDFGHVLLFYLHGDGGRGFKKDPIEIWSMFPALGAGTNKRPIFLEGKGSKRSLDGLEDMGINLCGNSGGTRFLFTVLGSSSAKKDKGAFDALMHLWGSELRSLLKDGFCANGSTWKVAILGFTGDAPFIKKVGKHNRSFLNVRKTGASTDQKGCCWLCLAGRESQHETFPFEHLGFWEPAWIATQGSANRVPWHGDGGPLLQYMLYDADDPASFYRPDLFHVYHAGVGKDFLAGAFIYAIKVCFGLGGVKRDLQALNAALATYLKGQKQYLHCGAALTEDLLGYCGTREYPEGKWSKKLGYIYVDRFLGKLLATTFV